MTLGVRPEHLADYAEPLRPGVARVDAPVDVVEPMGWRHWCISCSARHT